DADGILAIPVPIPNQGYQVRPREEKRLVRSAGLVGVLQKEDAMPGVVHPNRLYAVAVPVARHWRHLGRPERGDDGLPGQRAAQKEAPRLGIVDTRDVRTASDS